MEKLKKRIGLLGLSANPPHNGHLEAARLVLKSKLADVVWFVPCYEHPFDKSLIPFEHRWKMTLLMESIGIQATNIEFRLKGVSYTVNTVKALKKEYPQCDFFWIVGSDIVKKKSYKKWKGWQELASLVKFFMVTRKEFGVKKMPAGFIRVSSGKTSHISSTEIRERIRRGLPIDGLVSPRVKEYIEKHNLYK